MNHEFDPLDQHAQEAATSHDDEARRLQRLIEESDFKWLMGDKRGRRIVWRLLEVAGVSHTPFALDPYVTAFKCGEQNTGQRLLAQIHELCPERYHEMVKEQQDARRTNSREQPTAE